MKVKEVEGGKSMSWSGGEMEKNEENWWNGEGEWEISGG